MTDPRPQFDFGEQLQRRKRSIDRARDLLAGNPSGSRYDRLRALVDEARERLSAIPAPIMEHLPRLALVVETERAVVDELARLQSEPEVDPLPAVDELPADPPAAELPPRAVGKDAAADPEPAAT